MAVSLAILLAVAGLALAGLAYWKTRQVDPEVAKELERMRRIIDQVSISPESDSYITTPPFGDYITPDAEDPETPPTTVERLPRPVPLSLDEEPTEPFSD